jgi:hypothetical protein
LLHTKRAWFAWIGACVWAAGAAALPQRSLVARPLPPGVLAAAEAGGAADALDPAAARALTDSLLAAVSATRGLQSLRPVPVRVAGRVEVRARLEEITRQDGIEASLRQEQTLLRHLGLVPAATDVVRLYHDLLEEQLAGFYDIDRRELVLADWVPRASQKVVLEHELVHALQDQHFSLRVRKKLGFDSADAEAAWHAVIEGDATAVMMQLDLAPSGQSFTALADSGGAAALGAPAARAAAGGVVSERFRAAPRAVRESLSFPYAAGLRYVARLHQRGGWPAIDDAFVRPPASTEQVLHPDRHDNAKDAPIRIQIPDLRGMLSAGYRPALTGVMGEHDLEVYLSHYVDPELAQVAAVGWGGCAYALYESDTGEPPFFILASTWDSEDDAVEFFGGLIGAMEARHPKQTGFAEGSSQDQIIWNQDEHGSRLNVLRVRGRDVLCIEMLPMNALIRVLHKIDVGMTIDDPTPEMRAQQKSNLPWNRAVAPVRSDALEPRLALPPEWNREQSPDSTVVVAASRGSARIRLAVDRRASREIGLDGYAHAVAAEIQRHGQDIYVQTDADYPRTNVRMYQHVFTQVENGERIGYWLGVMDLAHGFGSLLVTGPETTEPALDELFYSLLGAVELAPAVATTTPAPSPRGP